MVEAPGTAPGSEWFIAAAVYRHSRPRDRHPQYKRSARATEGAWIAMHRRAQSVAAASFGVQSPWMSESMVSESFADP
jgi:hypothetical protein